MILNIILECINKLVNKYKNYKQLFKLKSIKFND